MADQHQDQLNFDAPEASAPEPPAAEEKAPKRRGRPRKVKTEDAGAEAPKKPAAKRTTRKRKTVAADAPAPAPISDEVAAARALGNKIFYVHGKDARIERGLADVDGLLENLPVDHSAERTWNYVAVGCGKDLQWWKEFFSVAHMMGYDGYVSLEMEDLTMSTEAGLATSIEALKATISR